VGATMNRNITTGHKLFAVDLLCKKVLRQKLLQIDLYYESIIDQKDLPYYEEVLFNELRDFNIALTRIPFKIIGYEYLHKFRSIIFEGSQGILLDMNHGIFPNVTYAETTSKNAVEICKESNIPYELYYVTRCYQTRHGNGFMSNEGGVDLINNEEEINTHNEWQKSFRIGELDYDLLNYSLMIDELYSGAAVKNLVVTCLDQRPDFIFEYGRLDKKFNTILSSYSPESASMKNSHKKHLSLYPKEVLV
jgi:adenylosuccinate synthase